MCCACSKKLLCFNALHARRLIIHVLGRKVKTLVLLRFQHNLKQFDSVNMHVSFHLNGECTGLIIQNYVSYVSMSTKSYRDRGEGDRQRLRESQRDRNLTHVHLNHTLLECKHISRQPHNCCALQQSYRKHHIDVKPWGTRCTKF